MAVSHALSRNPLSDALAPPGLQNEATVRLEVDVQETLLAFLPAPGVIAPIDPILDALAWHCSDPYAEIVTAVRQRLIVAEFGEPAPGATLRSVMVRRL